MNFQKRQVSLVRFTREVKVYIATSRWIRAHVAEPLQMARVIAFTVVVASVGSAEAGPYPPAAEEPGSTAVALDDPALIGWATGFENVVRGPQDINDPSGPLATFGSGDLALGPATGASSDVISLGDNGQITLSFAAPQTNGPDWDFAVFENSFLDTFLELAYVEASSNGVDFVRFPAISLTSTDTQVGGFGAIDPTNIHNLAGKYRAGFGTPFDLAELDGISPLLDIDAVTHVRLIDVVGRIDEAPGNLAWAPSLDSLGVAINEPYPTPFVSSGFDLDAVGVRYLVPEPSTGCLLLLAAICLIMTRKRAA